MTATLTFFIEHPRHAGVSKSVHGLADGAQLVIGRGMKADLRPSVSDGRISRKHCTLFNEGGKIYVENHSANGTKRWGNAIEGREELTSGDELRIGEMSLLVRFRVVKPSKSPQEELIGKEVAGYLIESLIAAGNLGVVYLAIQKSLNRAVAMRVLAGNHLADTEMATRFLKMSQLSSLLDHPNIVQLIDCGEVKAGGPYYMVMEYVDGPTLERRLEDGPLPVEEALLVFRQIGAALAFGHRKQIVHRDINPGNILINEDGMAKLTGLGMAKSLKGDVSRLTRTGMVMGSINYIAPEQAMDASRVDGKSDMFSLASVLYHCLTGQPPFNSSSRGEHFMKLAKQEKPPRASAINKDVPEALSDVIERALEFDPAQRFGSMTDMLDAVSQCNQPAGVDVRSLAVARRRFLAMLPDVPTIPGYEFAVLFSPAEEVGGDFYDFFPIHDNEFGIVIGDVSGHGVEGAMVVGMAKTSCRIFGSQCTSPAQALAALNREIMPCLEGDTFVSTWFGILNPTERSLDFARGGHNPLIVYNPGTGDLREYNPQGSVIGMLRDKFFRQEECLVELEPGDLMILYTDGVVEAMNADEEFFDTERFHDLIRGYQPGEDLNDLLGRIFADVQAWEGPQQDDDITLLAIRVDPDHAPQSDVDIVV